METLPINPIRLYRVREVMEIFGLSRIAVINLIESKQIRSRRLSRGPRARIRIPGQAILDFVADDLNRAN